MAACCPVSGLLLRRDGCNCRGFHRRMVAEIEVIVAGEGQEPAPIANDPRPLLMKTLGKRPAQAGALQLRQFAGGKIIQGLHRLLDFYSHKNSAAQLARHRTTPMRGGVPSSNSTPISARRAKESIAAAIAAAQRRS